MFLHGVIVALCSLVINASCQQKNAYSISFFVFSTGSILLMYICHHLIVYIANRESSRAMDRLKIRKNDDDKK